MSYLPPIKEVNGWYRFILHMFLDLREAFPSDRQKRLARYDELFQSVRFIHTDYISMIRAFIDDVHMGDGPKVKNAKRSFLKARRQHADQRMIDKLDASNFAELTDDIAEKRFLIAVLWYFHYRSNPGYVRPTLETLDAEIWLAMRDPKGSEGSWDSASTYFWDRIEENNSEYDLQEEARDLLVSVNERFLLILTAYNEIERSWRFEQPTTPTRLPDAVERRELF